MGNKQSTYNEYDKSADSSPTVTTKGLILSTSIDAYEGQDMAIFNIGTAFLHADNDEEIIMKLRGNIVELEEQAAAATLRSAGIIADTDDD